MKRKSLILLMAGVFVLLLVSGGIVANYKANQLLNLTGSLWEEKGDENSAYSQSTASSVPQNENGSTRGNTISSQPEGQQAANQSNPPIASNSAGKDIKVSDIEKRIGKPIEKQDIVKAGLILITRFSTNDIRYLKDAAMQDSWDQEEYQQSQKILLSRLSEKDINTLKELGKKYGIQTKILSPSAQ